MNVGMGRALREIWTDGSPLPEDRTHDGLGRRLDDGRAILSSSILLVLTTGHFGNPHSDEMKLEERYRRIDKNTVELSMKVDDPKTYTKPWESSRLILKLQSRFQDKGGMLFTFRRRGF